VAQVAGQKTRRARGVASVHRRVGLQAVVGKGADGAPARPVASARRRVGLRAGTESAGRVI